ncbi:MAG TPA: hypothetical protein VFP84_20665 [Kofleriaceae bacterium]|nr:hypothetical protein [Kofleriaceae bacterium]
MGACGFDETSPDASDEAAALDDASVDPSLRVCVAVAAPTAGQEPS